MKKNDTYYLDKEFKILTEITEFCKNDCGNKEQCSEESCILFRIESIITREDLSCE